jgi:hypothetical protein
MGAVFANIWTNRVRYAKSMRPDRIFAVWMSNMKLISGRIFPGMIFVKSTSIAAPFCSRRHPEKTFVPFPVKKWMGFMQCR